MPYEPTIKIAAVKSVESRDSNEAIEKTIIDKMTINKSFFISGKKYNLYARKQNSSFAQK
jgi:hypothetical protein